MNILCKEELSITCSTAFGILYIDGLGRKTSLFIEERNIKSFQTNKKIITLTNKMLDLGDTKGYK